MLVSRILSVAPVLPEYRYPQAEITAAVAGMLGDLGGLGDADLALLTRVHGSSGVRHRHLALPLPEYAGVVGFGAANDIFLREGTRLGAGAVASALALAGLEPADVDLLVMTSVTGIGAPSLDARIVPVLGLRPDIRRIPTFGLGCVAGAAGIARVHDLLRGDPDAVAVLLSVELCSLTVQRDDTSIANLVSSGLFGDGAAAVVMAGDRAAARLAASPPMGPAVVASRSRLYPDSERVLGWDVVDGGFRIVLSPGLVEIVSGQLGEDVAGFLADHDLKIGDIAAWVVHPGGPKVLDAVGSALDLSADKLERSWDSLARVGNLSSSSVLHILSDVLDAGPPTGEPGVIMAMGPGFAVELVLVTW